MEPLCPPPICIGAGPALFAFGVGAHHTQTSAQGLWGPLEAPVPGEAPVEGANLGAQGYGVPRTQSFGVHKGLGAASTVVFGVQEPPRGGRELGGCEGHVGGRP